MNAGEFLTLAPLDWYDGPRPVTETHTLHAGLLQSLVDRGWVTVSDGMLEITDEGREALARQRAESGVVLG